MCVTLSPFVFSYPLPKVLPRKWFKSVGSHLSAFATLCCQPALCHLYWLTWSTQECDSSMTTSFLFLSWSLKHTVDLGYQFLKYSPLDLGLRKTADIKCYQSHIVAETEQWFSFFFDSFNFEKYCQILTHTVLEPLRTSTGLELTFLAVNSRQCWTIMSGLYQKYQ